MTDFQFVIILGMILYFGSISIIFQGMHAGNILDRLKEKKT